MFYYFIEDYRQCLKINIIAVKTAPIFDDRCSFLVYSHVRFSFLLDSIFIVRPSV